MSWVEPPARAEVMAALHRSHEQLSELLDGGSERLVNTKSYAADWTIAQVASHLGSGAQCFELFLASGLEQAAPPGLAEFQPIWDAWNAKPPGVQAADAVAADANLLAVVDSLDPSTADGWRLDMFGTVQTLAGLMRMRLAEHVLHTWDIAVVLDPAATLSAANAEMLLGSLSTLVERVGKPAEARLQVGITTTEPDARLRLELDGDAAHLVPAEEASIVELTLPAESLVRLVYGRLDPGHTPPTVADDHGVLPTLRETFPGV